MPRGGRGALPPIFPPLHALQHDSRCSSGVLTIIKNPSAHYTGSAGRLLDVRLYIHSLAAMIHWRGQQQSLAATRFVKRKLQRAVLHIPSGATEGFKIPTVEKPDYLGVQVGYKHTLRFTMQRRLNACLLRRKQMTQWFVTNSLRRAQNCHCGLHVPNGNLWTGCGWG